MDENRNTADEIAHSTQKGIRMGADAARTAKTIASASAKSASGNVAGAVKDVLKDPKAARNALILALLPTILGILMLLWVCSLPTVLYEGVVSYAAALEEEWKEDVYGGSESVTWSSILASFHTAGSVVSDLVDTAWSWTTNVWNSIWGNDGTVSDESGEADEEPMEDGSEILVMSQADAERATLEKKIDVVIDKMDTRAEQICDKIESSKDDIEEWFQDTYKDTYDHVLVSTTIDHGSLTQSQAIKLMCAYTVAHGGSTEDLQISSFMKWLGYYKSLDYGHKTYFNIGGSAGITCKVDGWYGEFCPQYIMEVSDWAEELYNSGKMPEEDYRAICNSYSMSTRGAPAIDLFMIVDSPEFTEVVPTVTYENIYEERVCVDEEGNPMIDESGKQITETVFVRQESTATFAVWINVGIRSADTFAEDVVGFWDAALPGADQAEEAGS